jgi:hypothetical protein
VTAKENGQASHLERNRSTPLDVLTFPGRGNWDTATLTMLVQHARMCLGGLCAMVHRCDPATGTQRLAAAGGLDPAQVAGWAELDYDQDVAPVRAVRRGVFVWVSGDTLRTGAGGAAAVPLYGAEGPVGALSVLPAAAAEEPDAMQRSFLWAMAQWAGTLLDGGPDAPLLPGPVAGGERSVRMGDLTGALAEAVTAADVVQAVAGYVMPVFGADGLVFQVLESGRLHVVGAAGYPQEFIGLVDGIPLTAHAVVDDIVRTRTARFIESKAEITRRYPSLSRLSEMSPKEAWAFLPLMASGRVIGLCAVSFSEPRSFGDEQRTLLTALSGLVGQALERARLYDLEHARAQELQRGLLPQTLPRLPAVAAAARYLPAGRGEDVGGDWYDMIPLSADRVAMVIGDVMGHGITEAATMGRLRTAVRTLADLDMPPDELFSRLNDLVSDLGEDHYATCLYAVFDPVAGTCLYALAGNPPPVVVHLNGTIHSSHAAPDPPLGAAKPPFETHELRLPGENLLVLCTDGLIESSTRDADQGLAQLRDVLSQAVGRTDWAEAGHRDHIQRLEDLCDTVVSALLPDRGQTTDDACLLIADTRSTGAGDYVSWSLPQDPRAAGQAREYIRQQLGIWGLDDLTLTTELLVSELVGNVVRHARAPIRLRLLRSTSLTCEVYDGSLTMPRIRHASYTDEGGRGLQLVAAMSRRWGTRYLPDGKCIWTEQDIGQRVSSSGGMPAGVDPGS